MRSALLAPFLVAACSLSLDESLIHDAGAGGTHFDAGAGGSSTTGGTAGDASSSGGNDGSATGGTGGASTGGTGGASTGGTGGTGAGGTGGTGGSDAAAGTGGTAGASVDCGNTSCDLATSYCCHAFALDGGTSQCADSATTCATMKLQCDSTDDCPAAHLCCLDGTTAVHCLATCPAGGIAGAAQFCKSDAECSAGKTCKPVTTLVALLVPSSYMSCQ